MQRAACFGDGHAFFVPFVCADEAEKLVERQQKGGVVGRAVNIGKRCAYLFLRRARQPEREACADFHKQHVGGAGGLGLGKAVSVKGGGGVGFGVFRLPFLRGADAFFQGGQHLCGIVVIAVPQCCRAVLGGA